MSISPYTDYRDSEVGWLADIPATWDVAKFRHIFRESGEKIEDEVVGPMLSVSGYRGIEIKDYDDENQRRSDEDLVGYRIVRPGQLVVNTMWLNYAGLGVSEHEGHVSPAYRSYWIEADIDPRYIHHLMRSSIYVQGYTQLLTGIRPNSLQMSRDNLMGFPVLLPPRQDQQAIVAFLDRETAKIDALVEEQERLIALLKEKRQAVISHVVTKGFDFDAPTKDSGNEWFGKIPAHWKLVRLSAITSMIQSGPFGSQLHADDYIEGGVPLINPANLNDGRIVPDEANTVGEELVEQLDHQRFKLHDIIVGRRGELGRCAVVTEREVGWLCGTGCLTLRLLPDAVPDYVSVYLSSYPVREMLSLSAVGSTMANLNSKILGDLPMPFPDRLEQRELLSKLSASLASLNDLIDHARTAISLLNERRAALVSAAVTGKIDVRGLVELQEMEAA